MKNRTRPSRARGGADHQESSGQDKTDLRAATAKTQLLCPGCDRIIRVIGAVGIWEQPPFSRVVAYLLCFHCFDGKTPTQRVAIAEIVETRLCADPARYGVRYGRVVAA